MRTTLAVVMSAMLAAVAHATVIVPADLSELSREARAIARGRVVAVDARWSDDRRSIETIVTMAAETYLKGQLGDVVQFRVPGGVLGRYRSITVGAPQFVAGDHVIVFLGAYGPQIPHVLGLNQGAFHMEQSSAGEWTVVPPPLLTAPGPIVRGRVARGPARLADFERDVRALVEQAK